MVDGVWQSDSSQHTAKDPVMQGLGTRPSVSLAPRKGMPVLKVAYFVSGLHRTVSIAEYLKAMCKKSAYGLRFYEIDVLVGGKEHNLMDKTARISGSGGSKRASVTSALSHHRVAVGAGPVGPMIQAHSRVGTESTHGGFRANAGPNNGEPTWGMSSSSS